MWRFSDPYEWWIGVNVRNTKTYDVSAVKRHLIFAFYYMKISPLTGLPGVQYIPVIAITNEPQLQKGSQLASDVAVG
jgi:hypothetical protein